MSTTIPISKDSLAPTQGDSTPSFSRLEQEIAEWLQGRLWHKAAPEALRRKGNGLDLEVAWQRWSKHLAGRKPALDFSQPAAKTKKKTTKKVAGKLLSQAGDPLDWGMPVADQAADWRETLDQQLNEASSSEGATGSLRATLTGLMHDISGERLGRPVSTGVALRAVVAAHRLPQLAAPLDPEEWWQLALALRELAESELAEGQGLDPDECTPSHRFVATLLGGELPLVLSLQLAELQPFRSLRSPARKFLSEGLLAATDGEGILDARLLPVAPALMACWTRCRAMGEGLKKNCWSSAAETQFEWLVRQMVRLLRADGSLVLSSQPVRQWPAGVIDLALHLSGDDSDFDAASARVGKRLASTDGKFDSDNLPDAAGDSEWASFAMLADGWDKKSNRVAIDYSQRNLQLEVESQGRVLLSGSWTTETQFAGKLLKPVGEWEQQCWFSDEDCDFLDLVLELTGGARLERQFFLGKEDDFLLMHDILHSPKGRSGEWRHHVGVPFGQGIEFAPEKETRDGHLVDAKGTTRAAVLPLSLPEWRIETRFGNLDSDSTGLQLVQHAKGSRMSCPLWFDLRGRRATKQRTWRNLTVAASLEVVPADVAVGYRVQSGSAQWLSYRSLAPPANRTVLGQNTSAEMLIGRFLRTGELDELLEVDPA